MGIQIFFKFLNFENEKKKSKKEIFIRKEVKGENHSLGVMCLRFNEVVI
jgi:hypothetical protein